MKKERKATKTKKKKKTRFNAAVVSALKISRNYVCIFDFTFAAELAAIVSAGNLPARY